MTEAQFQRQVVDLAERLGWLTTHVRVMIGTRAGLPDLLMLRHGRLVVAELKTGRRTTTPAQRETLQAWQDAGAEAVLWRPDAPPAAERWSGICETSEEVETGDFGAIGRRLGLGVDHPEPIGGPSLADTILGSRR